MATTTSAAFSSLLTPSFCRPFPSSVPLFISPQKVQRGRRNRRDPAGQTRIRKRREKEVEASKWTGYSLSPCSLPHLFRTVDERSIITWSASLSPSRCTAFLSLRRCPPHLLTLCLFSLFLPHSFFSPSSGHFCLLHVSPFLPAAASRRDAGTRGPASRE